MHFKTFDQYNSQYEGRSMIVLLRVSKRLALLPEIYRMSTSQVYHTHSQVFYIAKHRHVFHSLARHENSILII